MENLDVLLSIIAGAFVVMWFVTNRRLSSSQKIADRALSASEKAIKQRDVWEKQAKALREKGVSLPPECEHCGELKIDPATYKGLIATASEAHAFACPETLARVPHYGAVVRMEKDEKEALKNTPVEVVLESHKTLAEEARKYGAKSLAELKAARHEDDNKKTGTN